MLARRAVVDELGDLLVSTAPHKANFARLEALKKTIRDWFVDDDPAESFVAHGDNYEATLGPKGNQTVIEDMQAVYDAMGHDAFLKTCAITIGNLEKELSAGRAAALTAIVQTGPRPLAVTELP